MSTQNTNGLNYIIQAINNIVEPKVSSLKYDKTYRAKVTQQIDTGIYMVQINNIEYRLSYSGTLNVGDIVKVKAPLNNFSDIYIEAMPGSGGSGGTTNYNDLTNKPVLNSNYTNSQVPNDSEIIKGIISLHKISKTGNYGDLNNLPDLNFIPISQKGKADGVATLGANSKVPKEELPDDTVYDSNYVHTDENFTSILKSKLDGIDAGAQVNKIEVVQKNGTPLPITNKTVNVIVPTKTSDLINDGDGTLPFISSLPIATTNTLGGIKVGANLNITSDGFLNATGGSDRVQIFSGSIAGGNPMSINTTWKNLGKFKNLLLELYLTSVNSMGFIKIPYELLSDGDNLYDGKRNINVYTSEYIFNGIKVVHCIPTSNITENTIQFDGFEGVILKMYIDY